MLDKNPENVGPEKLPFEESARAWEGLVEQDKKDDVKASSEHQTGSSRPSALVFGAEVLSGFHGSRCRPPVRPKTEAHHVSELQEFANFAQVPVVADIAPPELDSKLVKYLEGPMILGRHSSKDWPRVLHEGPWKGKQSRMGLPRACREQIISSCSCHDFLVLGDGEIDRKPCVPSAAVSFQSHTHTHSVRWFVELRGA